MLRNIQIQMEGKLGVDVIGENSDKMAIKLYSMDAWLTILLGSCPLPNALVSRLEIPPLFSEKLIEDSFDDPVLFGHFRAALKEAHSVEVKCSYPITGEEYLIVMSVKFVFSETHKTKWRIFQAVYSCGKQIVFVKGEEVEWR